MIMLNKLILNLPNVLISETGTGTLVNLIFVGIAALIFIFLINKGFKKFPSSDILDVAEFGGKKFLKVIIGILYILLFFSILFIFLADFSNLLKRVYYQEYSSIFIFIFFIFGILLSNLIGFKSIIRMINFLFPLVVLSILVAFIGTMSDFSIENLTPIFGYNYKTTFVNGLLNIMAFSFIGFFYFLQPLLKNPEDFKKVNYISFFICFALLFITIASVLSLLPADSISLSVNPLYLIARKVNFGEFLQRLDGLFILFWILSLLCYLSSLVFFISLIFSKIANITDLKMITYPICMLLFGALLYPIDIAEISIFESTILRYGIIAIIFIISPIILLISNFKFSKLNKKGFKNEIIKKA
jgi:spore germination protein (amino acid permease)